ncbi:MAG: hypothetical protein HY225_01820 [Candidatus Vogelbacteria bacterium]|nr:hypothetical protein [Candidatus Vogelbacteria bacterium]
MSLNNTTDLKVIPSVDDLVKNRVAQVGNSELTTNDYIWKSGWNTILLHLLSLTAVGIGLGSLTMAALALSTYFFFMFFQLASTPLALSHLYLNYIAQLVLVMGAGGAGALTTAKFLEGKAKDQALQLVADEYEQNLLTGGNYFRTIEEAAKTRINTIISEELQPFLKRKQEHKDELDVLWTSWRDTQKLMDTPNKRHLIELLNADIKTTNAKLADIETKIRDTQIKTKEFQYQIAEVAAHAPILDIQHKRMLREDKDLLEADTKRHAVLDDIGNEIESTLISAQVETGIGPIEADHEVKKIEDKK